jgi:hypothetical protein
MPAFFRSYSTDSFLNAHLRVGWWLFATFVLRISLDVSYYFYVAWDFSGDGFLWNPSPSRYLESIGAILLMTLTVPRQATRITDFLVLMLFVLCVLPITSYYGLMGGSRTWFWALMAQFLVYRCSILWLPDVAIEYVRRKPCPISPALITALAITFAVAFHVALNGGNQTLSFSFQNVYQQREISSLALEQGVWGYLVGWASKVCAIYITIDGCRRKKWWLVILGVSVSLALYGVFAHKSTVLAMVAALAIWIAWPVVRLCSAIVVYLLASFLLVLFIVAPFLEINWPQTILVRRLFYIPARLSFIYFEYFNNFDPLYFSNGFLKSYFQYPFDKPYPMLIGEYSGIGGKGTYANNGFLATGFMQLGWSGIIIYPVVAALISKVVDWFASNEDHRFFVAVCFFPFSILFTSSDLPTSVVTHGIGLALLLLFLDRLRGPSDTTISKYSQLLKKRRAQ